MLDSFITYRFIGWSTEITTQSGFPLELRWKQDGAIPEGVKLPLVRNSSANETTQAGSNNIAV